MSVDASIELALDLCARTAGDKGVDLLHWVDDAVPAAVWGDATRFNQVLLNLVNNAVKFTSVGTVTVSATVVGPESIGSLQTQVADGLDRGPWLRICVQDTGIGIDPQLHGRLFKAFSQVDNSMTRRFGGTGLGLAISDRIVSLMGGRLWVESIPGVGSNFQFEVPLGLADGDPNRAQPEAGMTPKSGASLRSAVPAWVGKTLLIVGAAGANQANLGKHLARLGATIATASSPETVAQRLQDGLAIDAMVVCADAGTAQNFDGFCHRVQTLRALSNKPMLAVVPVQLGCDEIRVLLGLGANATLTKPVKVSALAASLGQLLNPQIAAAAAAASALPTADKVAANSVAPATQPMKILVAEDNEVNQLVISRVLQSLGFGCELASDGRQALDAIAKALACGSGFDVVLMDVQMPQMDGIEASIQLTQGAEMIGTRYRPWIIAMTANAMQGDRERCTAAGMDDYVGKPIRIALVQAALDRARDGLAARRG